MQNNESSLKNNPSYLPCYQSRKSVCQSRCSKYQIKIWPKLKDDTNLSDVGWNTRSFWVKNQYDLLQADHETPGYRTKHDLTFKSVSAALNKVHLSGQLLSHQFDASFDSLTIA